MPTSSAVILNSSNNKVYSAAGNNDTDVSFLLPEANQPSVGLEMRLLGPLMESKANAYHRFAHPSAPYRVKIGIKGGKPPFRYTIVEGPSGATMFAGNREQTFTPVTDVATGKTVLTKPDFIGVLAWQASGEDVGSTVFFRVKVEDQRRKVVFATWYCTVDAGAFLVYDSVNGNTANPGTWAEPLANFDGHATMPTGKIGLFKDGTYPVLSAMTYLNDGISKMQSFIGVGSNVIFDMTQGQFGGGSWCRDISFINIEFSGQIPANSTVHIFDFGGGIERALWLGCRWTNITETGNTSNNPACLFFANISGSQEALIDIPKEYWNRNIIISDCSSDETVFIQHTTTFSSRYVLYENNVTTFPPSTSAPMYAAHFKDKTSDITARFNYCSGPNNGFGGVSFANQSAFHCFNQELCFNVLNLTSGSPILWNGQNTQAGNVANGQRLGAINQYVYRNTLICRNNGSVVYLPRYSYMQGCETVKFEDNLMVTDGPDIFSTNYSNSDGWELIGVNDKLQTTTVDGQGRLVGSSRTSRLGFEGAEIAY